MEQEKLANLIAVAQGKCKAEIVFKGGHIFNSFTGSWEKGDLALYDNVIAGIGSYEGIKEIDVQGKYLTPGFLDAHMHIESSMLAPRELSKILLLNGVTSIFADPHEIANVMGTVGLDLFLQETEDIPLDVFFMLPSCVPATPLETSGAVLKAENLKPYLKHERILGMGEMMNYPGVLLGDQDVLDKLRLVRNGLCDGHAPHLEGKALNAYLACGVTSEHEATTPEEAEEKLRRGAYIFLREASGAHNLLDLLPMVTALNCRRCCLATDDRHLDELVSQGSINYMLEIGVIHGYPVEQLLQMATLNTAECFRLYDRGALAPGYRADINIFDNLINFQPQMVVKNGQIIIKEKKLLWQSPPILTAVSATMNIGAINGDKLILTAKNHAKAKVIEIIPGQLWTKSLSRTVKIQAGQVISDIEQDILKIAVWERHHASEQVGLGLVHGFALKKGALASSVAHDAHNLLVVGTNDNDMLLAVEELVKCGGGAVVVADGEVKALLPLPIAGLMSDKNAEYVQNKLQHLNYWARELGVPDKINPFMMLSFLALSVIPSLKITDKGLVDVDKFTLTDLWE